MSARWLTDAWVDANGLRWRATPYRNPKRAAAKADRAERKAQRKANARVGYRGPRHWLSPTWQGRRAAMLFEKWCAESGMTATRAQ